MGTSGLMSGGGKRGGATASVPAPNLDSTLRPTSTSASSCADMADSVARRAGPGGPAQDWSPAPRFIGTPASKPSLWLDYHLDAVAFGNRRPLHRLPPGCRCVW